MIGIICVGQIELSPFVKKYISVFEKNNVKYDIIHWDRTGGEREDAENVYTYTEQLDRYASKIKKLLPFLKFSRFVKKIVNEKKYDSLVVLTTQTALLMLDTLFFKYKNRYFFDYRDTSYEYIKPYSYLINKISDFSMGMCISSPGFREYIKTKKNVVIAHNFRDDCYDKRLMKCNKTDGKIVMGYIGVLREYEYLKKMVTAFGNDPRFEFRIHGGGDDLDKLAEYSKNFDNVLVAGAYKEEEKQDILTSFDMICYNYPYSFVNYPAVANKFYDGMIMKKPMFANIRTFSGKLIQENGLGISIDQDDESLTDKIYEYYQGFDAIEFENSCEKFLDTVIEDEKKYIREIEKIVL